jgi:hypothetical protein
MGLSSGRRKLANSWASEVDSNVPGIVVPSLHAPKFHCITVRRSCWHVLLSEQLTGNARRFRGFKRLDGNADYLFPVGQL